MGIKEFWPVFFDERAEGRVVNLYELASYHIRDTGRPYRIAVDTPYWVFKNLTEDKVEAIRKESRRASNPIDKAILYRMMRFAIHGIQVVLVFDGDRKPEKRGKEGCNAEQQIRPLLKEAAEKLGFPWWQAPAEAEAECARMQELGIVDAVFSEDSDTFMFKGTTLLRFHMEKSGKKSNTHARMYRMSEIRDSFSGMDWKSLVLFAAVVGGDYAMKGLPGCGPKVALDAARQGFGVSLVDAFKNTRFDQWRQSFGEFLKGRGTKITISASYPSVSTLKDCIEPRVSDEKTLRSGIAWGLDVDHRALRFLITSRFNFSVQEYIQWVARMLVVRKLLSGQGDLDELGLKFVKKVSRKESGNIAMSVVSYILTVITDRNLLETWPEKVTNQTSRKNLSRIEERAECGIPDSIIRLALPDLLEEQPTKAKRPTDNASRSAIPPEEAQEPGLKRKPGRPRKVAANGPDKTDPHGGAQGSAQKRKPGRPRKDRGPGIDAEHPTKKPKTDHKDSPEASIHRTHSVGETPSISTTKSPASRIGTVRSHQGGASSRVGQTERQRQIPQQDSGQLCESHPAADLPDLIDLSLKVSQTRRKPMEETNLVDDRSDDYLDADLDDDTLANVLGEGSNRSNKLNLATGKTWSQGVDLTDD